MASAADFADLPGHMQTGFSRSRRGKGSDELWSQNYGLLNVEGSAAFSAKGVGRPVLNQAAEIAADNFARFCACQG
jgi:hypothetical protein